MLIRDDATIERMDAGERRDEHRQEIADTVTHQLGGRIITDLDSSPTNAFRQWGNAMGTLAFEAKLATIVPDFIRFMPHPTNDTKRAVFLAMPSGTLESLGIPYEFPFMPEHSIMQRQYEDVADMSVDNISGKDMPKGEWVNGKWEFDTTNAALPGYKRQETVGKEIVRGWRTVLLKLILLQVITPAQAERVFGADNRREWADKTGKIEAPTPW